MENIQALLSNATPVQWGTAAAAVISLGLVYATSRKTYGSGRHYPPGPPKLLLIGNAHNFPVDNCAVVFNEWQKLYGDIIHIQLPGTSFVIVNSFEIAQELFNKRAKFNSDRNVGHMIMKLMGWEWTPIFRNADIVHSTERTMFKRGIGPTKMPLKDPLIESHTQQLVLDLQRIKGNPRNTIVNIIGMTIIELAYGRGIVKDHGVELTALNVEAMRLLNQAVVTVWAVDLSSARHGAYSKQLVDRIREWPFQMAIERHKAGTLGHCLADDLINEFGTRFEVQDTLASLYLAGVDTTSTVVVQFLHAMFVFPEIAKKVQAEIDSVIGRERLPSVKDRADLPYTNAVWKESLRLKCAAPVGAPRSNMHDETINGYFIPKGSIINSNFGFMLNNPKIWGDPEIFRPERFLSAEASALPDPTVLIFGFGARICPGMYFADRTGFHMAVSTMALFDIKPLPGELVPLYTEVEYTKTLFRLPVKFDCSFAPRDSKATHLLSSLALGY
ncbi:SubName: Full=Uncharacterized protein {ECO:0000313/EMBL:CCA75453.1} [Serendipita indica DSM 11827]|nr:SubName: Full=Uncharacterized protein {ECO:0000313/EMBL:CCA75453.1} [Serendipita indica DSM 11827]